MPTAARTARDAGELFARAGLSDAILAIVAAEALVGAAAAMLTGDPTDIAELVQAGGGQARVSVQGV